MTLQRLRGAFDSIAEEQARQRPQTQSPSGRPARSSSARTASQPQRVQRNGNQSSATQQSSPAANPDADPDPAKFDDTDEILNLFETEKSSTDDPELTSHGEVNVERQGNTFEVGIRARHDDAGTADTPTDLSSDTKSKLRKLNRLETKYQGKSTAPSRASPIDIGASSQSFCKHIKKHTRAMPQLSLSRRVCAKLHPLPRSVTQQHLLNTSTKLIFGVTW